MPRSRGRVRGQGRPPDPVGTPRLSHASTVLQGRGALQAGGEEGGQGREGLILQLLQLGVICCPVHCSPGSLTVHWGPISCLSEILQNPTRRWLTVYFRVLPGSAATAWQKARRTAANPGLLPMAQGKGRPLTTTSMSVVRRGAREERYRSPLQAKGRNS